jgi:bla regulator protein BlaR1
MNFAAMILPQRIVEALGWTLFHSLWQGALAALGFALVLYFSRRNSARVRYALGLATLLLVLVASLATFRNHYAAFGAVPAPGTAVPAVAAAAGSPVAAGETLAAPARGAQGELSPARRIAAFFSDYFSRNLPLIVTLWLLGVLFLTLRFAGGMMYVERLKYSQSRPLPEPWPGRLRALAAKAGLRRPLRLLESLRLHTPVVIGHLKPVLLLPAGLVTGLPADEVEALLAHELAHVMRRDYLVNVVQNLVEILYFFHPGVRWISACVRQEREHCCDDFAVTLCGDPCNYARALARLQAGGPGYPEPALAASGRGHKLLRRIARLLGRPRLAHDFREGFLSALLLVVGLLAMLKLAGAVAPAAASTEVKPKPPTTVKSSAGRFVLVSFVLENAGTVRLEGGVPTQWGKLPSTWLVDGRDGRVVWYMTLAPGATKGQLIPFNEEVALEAGTYGWYFPMGSAIGVSSKGTDGKYPWMLMHVESGGGDFLLQRRLNDVEMLRAEREKQLLKQEKELRTMSVAERELKEKELQMLTKERAELDRQLALAKNERQLKQEQEQALFDYARQLNLEQSLQEQKVLKYEEELKALSGAERELKEKEIQKFTQELRAKSDAINAMKEEESRKLEQELQAKSAARAMRETERQANEMEKFTAQEQMQADRLREEEKRLRAEEERLRAEELKFKKFMAELVAAGLVEEGKSYEIKLSAAALVINGKKQPAAVHEKIMQFYETLTGTKLEAKRTVTIVNDK